MTNRGNGIPAPMRNGAFRAKSCWLILVLLFAPACSQRSSGPPNPASAVTGPAALDALLERMRQRLDLMHEVAKVKWNAKRPIRDVEREKALLQDVVERGRAIGLDQEFTRAFFTAQIDAATLIQESDFQQWQDQKQPLFADVTTLPALRQKIDRINSDLLAILPSARSFLQTTKGQEQLAKKFADRFAEFPASVREAAVRPLIRSEENPLVIPQ